METRGALANSLTPYAGFYVRDKLSDCLYLVDTGAFVSVYPASDEDRINPRSDGVQLVSASGGKIPTYGSREVNLSFGGRNFSWEFTLADVRKPLLGADFLAHYSLLVDVANRRLVDEHFYPLSIDALSMDVDSCAPYRPCDYDFLFKEFPDVFRPELRQVPGLKPKHGIYHRIHTTGPPVYSRPRRLNPEKLRAAKLSFSEMERMGLCKKGASPWASPLHLVPKSDGSLRPCGDYRRLNNVTVPDRYAPPAIVDIFSSIQGASVFSKLDLLKGFFQVPVHPDDVEKTAISTPFGTYLFYFSTFGLRNSGATFQRLMDSIFGELTFCAVYVDDILLFSKSHEEHATHLRTVLQLLQDNGLVVRPDKCVFGVDRVSFLGHDISSSGVAPLQSRVDAIRRFPRPTSVKALQEFLGVVNYYHRFISHAAEILSPLYDVLGGPTSVELNWTDSCDRAFEAAKTALVESATLSFPVPRAPLVITTDASNVAVGAVLEQIVDGQPRPLAFFSRKLRKPERKYSTFDRELLAIYLAIRHFKHYVDGASDTRVRTDHKPIVCALTKASDSWSARQQRHLSAIAELGCTVEYLPGAANPVADALSRVELDTVVAGLDYSALAAAQATDPEVAAYRTAVTGLRLRDVCFGTVSIICDVSTGRPRPLVPEGFRRQVFDLVHGLAHPSARSTGKLVAEKFVWHRMNRDVRSWTRTCVGCQTAKVTRHTESGVGVYRLPKRRFGDIHVDFVGPLPPSNGHSYLFTLMERTTRWPEAVPVRDTTAETAAEVLVNCWISRFGVPDNVVSDRGAAFVSDLWSALAKLMGTRVHRTTAYNPASNGMVERSHRTMKAALTARCAGNDWFHHLPWVMLGLRTCPKEGLDASPAEMVYGEPLVVPGEFFPSEVTQDARQELERARMKAGRLRPFRPTKTTERPSYVNKDLLKTEYVFVRNDAHRPPLCPSYRGPFFVIKRNDKAFQLRCARGPDWVSIDRLKPAYLDATDVALQQTRSGRIVFPPRRYQA